MSTLAQLADECQTLLSDAAAATWSQTAVEGWLNLAIADYSIHFPRRSSAAITTTAATRCYDLPAAFIDILTVEYPAAQDPPQYLSRLSYRHPDFWRGDHWYDVVGHSDSTDPAELWISRKPSAGQTITVHYTAPHDHALASGDTVTVPSRHANILVAFVFWKANQELLAAEQQSPTSNSSLLMGQLAANADRGKRAYTQVLAQALQAAEASHHHLVQWRTAEIDPIY